MTEILITAAKLMNIPATLLLAICTTESNLKNVINPDDGGSPSYGICQVKLGTAKMFSTSVTQHDLMLPRVNAHYAALYVRYQLKRYRYNIPNAISAYNAGSLFLTDKGKHTNEAYVIKVRSKYKLFTKEK